MQTLTAPEGGTPTLIETPSAFAAAIKEIAAGHGPIAIDVERASGYRYSARAYLIQIFRRGGGLHLIDPIPLHGRAEIAELQALLEGEESIIHASSQDLPSLREFGINPKFLFDTELGARLAGLERVGLGPLCESLLDISLAKEHSAVDWSIRPLRSEWLDYAALDVALLVDLRDAVAANLEAQGKIDWARAEFAAALAAPKSAPRVDPWRRTSGMHQIKSRYELALIRELWLARDLRAQEIDLAPGRLLSDAVIVELAMKKPEDESSFRALPIMKERIRNQVQREHLSLWWQVLSKAYAISEAEWPQMRARGEAIPPARIWRNKFPLAAIHLANVRAGLAEISSAKNIPIENIISPELVRKVVFDEGRERSFANQPSLEDEIRNRLKEFGARDWQIELAAPALAIGLANDQPPPEPQTPPAE